MFGSLRLAHLYVVEKPASQDDARLARRRGYIAQIGLRLEQRHGRVDHQLVRGLLVGGVGRGMRTVAGPMTKMVLAMAMTVGPRDGHGP